MANGSPSQGALDALAHAQAMQGQTDPAIWFDSWNNDLRDNNLDGRFDDADPAEARLKGTDGLHYGKLGHPTLYKGRAAPLGMDHFSTRVLPSYVLRDVRVTYKVCVDVPIESYHAARVPFPPVPSRRVGDMFASLKRTPGWKVWDGTQPDTFFDGDIVAANNAEHQHAGVVETGMIYDSVIHLPGPTSARRGVVVFTPTGLNDMIKCSYQLFDEYLHVDLVARWTGS